MEFASRQELLEAMKSPDPARRERAICEAGMLEDPSLLPHLFETIDDPSPRIRWRALQSIGRLGASEAGDRVLGLLEDTSSLVRAEAARVVGLGGRKEHTPSLSPLLEDDDLQVRCRAIEAVGEIGEPVGDLLERIVTLLRDGDSRIRMHAALALGKCRHTRALPQLVRALRDPSHNVRGLSAWSLGNLGRKGRRSPDRCPGGRRGIRSHLCLSGAVRLRAGGPCRPGEGTGRERGTHPGSGGEAARRPLCGGGGRGVGKPRKGT